MNAAASAGAGFLLAVLWFDLMFDVQVRGHAGDELPEPVLASIGGYYRRVTTAARPMNRLVAAVMVATVAVLTVQVARGDDPRWAGWGCSPWRRERCCWPGFTPCRARCVWAPARAHRRSRAPAPGPSCATTLRASRRSPGYFFSNSYRAACSSPSDPPIID